MRNYIETFWIGFVMVDSTVPPDPPNHWSQTLCGGEPDELQDAVNAFDPGFGNPPWTVESYFQAIGPNDLDGFQPERYFMTLNKQHLIYILSVTDLPAITSTFLFDLDGSNPDAIFRPESPRKDWSRGE